MVAKIKVLDDVQSGEIEENMHSNRSTEQLIIAKNLKTAQVSIDRKLVKLQFIQEMKYKMANKRNKVEQYVCTDMTGLQDILVKNTVRKKKGGGGGGEGSGQCINEGKKVYQSLLQFLSVLQRNLKYCYL